MSARSAGDTGARRGPPRRCPSRSVPPACSGWPLVFIVVIPGCIWLHYNPGPLDRFDAAIGDAVVSLRTGWLDTFARSVNAVASRVGLALHEPGHRDRRGVVPALAAPRLVHDRRGDRGCLDGRPDLPRGAAETVRRHDDRRLGGVLSPVHPDRGVRCHRRRGRVHARGAGTPADVRQGRRHRPAGLRGPVAHLPRGRPLHRRGVRDHPRHLDPGRDLPRVRAERRLPRALRGARQDGAPRRHRQARRGDQGRDEGSARLRSGRA